MINQDVIDLYDQVALGTKVVVLGSRSSGSRRS
jgi:lipoprotein-anchoring transpeptidase ErfK/SrfK